jgi:heavy metal sensor kinase
VNVRSLKFRLVAWYAGWLTLVFIIFGIFVYLNLGHELENALHDALRRRARQVAETIQRSSFDWNVLKPEIRSHFASEINNRLTRVSVNNVVTFVSGPPTDSSFVPEQVPMPRKVALGESYDLRRLPDGEVLLVAMIARQIGTNRMVVEEGASVEPLNETLHRWLIAFIAGLAALVSVTVLGGFLLVQHALRPVDRIIRSADRISSRNLSERLPVVRTHDEIERLSTTLNRMIHRLDEGMQQNRRFFADASHELRTPITIIQAELDLLLEHLGDKTETQRIAAGTLEEVERLKNIVVGLFALSRLDAGEGHECSEPFNLSELVVTTANQMELLAADKNISVTCHSEPGAIVNGDRPRIKQVVVNLLDNAIKYTPEGGQIHVNVATRNGNAILEVADNGIGIPREAMPRLFDRFFRVDKARSRELGGAGLGLAIVKSICSAHGGGIRAESKEGEGSRFIVELPLANH